jgi:hypothetical protein
MPQFDFDAPWPLAEPPAFDLPTDMRALVVARNVLQDESDVPNGLPPEFVILASADHEIRAAHLDLVDNALRIHVGIALAVGYDVDALADLGVDDELLHDLGIWDYTRSQVEPPSSP